MIKIINKCNYSGDKAKIKINQAKHTMICQDIDYIFKIRKTHNDIWEVYYIDMLTMYKYEIRIMTVFKMDNYYTAGHTYIGYGEFDITRDNECIYTAIAQLAYNLI